MNQNERVIRHLQDSGSITPVEALAEYGIMRLASRISDLKRMGYDISAEMVGGHNRYGEPTRYARYRLGGRDE